MWSVRHRIIPAVLGASVACSTTVDRRDGTGGDDAGSTSSAGSTGSASSSGSIATTATSTGGGGEPGNGGAGAGGEGGAGKGGRERSCGGITGEVCEADEWCDFPDDLCGGADGLGTCQPRPQGCPADCPGVCGCDGAFHCNACSAQAEGTDVSALAQCREDDADYSAEAFFGGLDHLILTKVDAVRDVCVSVHLARPTESAPEMQFATPEEWGVQDAFISNSPADCDGLGDPPGLTVFATGGAGTVTFNVPPDGVFPCDITVHGELYFPPDEPFVLATEPLDADMVLVEGGCL